MSAEHIEQHTLWFARHGERLDFVRPAWADTAERPYDPPLTERGRLQARALGWRLAGEQIERIFASPFLRTLQTASVVAEIIEAPICVEHGACEWLNVEWFPGRPEFPPPEQLAAEFPRIDPGYRSRVEPLFPESWLDHVERGEDAALALLEAFEGDFLVVGHAASVMTMVRGLLGDRRLEVGTGECSLTKVVDDGRRWALELNGDTTHLAGIEGDSFLA